MKRTAVITGIVLSAVIAIGAFVIAGGEQPSEAKASPSNDKVVAAPEKKEQKSTKDFALAVASAKKSDDKVSSESPVPPGSDKSDDKDDSKDESNNGSNDDSKDDDDKYEARKQFVGVSPREVKAGRSVEVQVRGFAGVVGGSVTVKFVDKKTGATTASVGVTVNSKGRGKLKVPAPTVGGTYNVVVGSTVMTTFRVK